MVVGILTTRGRHGFSGNKANFRALSRMGKRMKIPVYVVPVEGIDLKQQLCVGYNWNSGWKPMIIPLPSVFYNRISTRKAENRFDVVQMKKSLLKRGIPIFNPSFFDKGELYNIIGSHPATKDSLPDTSVLSFANLKRMLSQYGKVYVKPTAGKAGQGIMRVDRTGRGILVHSQANGRRQTHRISLSSLYRKLQNSKKYKPYVLQQSIDLASTDGRPYDLRILSQKDRTGQWKITGIGARVAPANGIMTHVPNGGSIRNVQDVLKASFQDRADSIIASVQRKAITIANVIEENLQGTLGEVSLDLGVDQKGRIWFFEANAKPMKFDEPEIRKLSLQRLLEYCEHLSQTKTQ